MNEETHEVCTFEEAYELEETNKEIYKDSYDWAEKTIISIDELKSETIKELIIEIQNKNTDEIGTINGRLQTTGLCQGHDIKEAIASHMFNTGNDFVFPDDLIGDH